MHIEIAIIPTRRIRRHTTARIRKNPSLVVVQIEIAVGSAPDSATLAPRGELPMQGVGPSVDGFVCRAGVGGGDGVVAATKCEFCGQRLSEEGYLVEGRRTMPFYC